MYLKIWDREAQALAGFEVFNENLKGQTVSEMLGEAN